MFENYFSEMFTMQGRINRAKYWGYSILTGIIFGIPAAIATSVFQNGLGLSIYIVLSLVSTYVGICQSVKRAHDLDKSGLFILLMLVPLVNLYPAILLAFVKGTDGQNSYGLDPLAAYNLNEA